MAGTALPKRFGWLSVTVLSGMAVLVGCIGTRRFEPVTIANPAQGSMTIAVAPALNLSGSADFDANRFADLMASELSFADGVSVIPVSRVLGVLATQGRHRVQSPTHALEIAGLLGADAILVFAVTEYDPYEPPSIGISAELYGARPWMRRGAPDPQALSRQARLSSDQTPSPGRRLLAQSQRVFNASHQSVVADIRRFAQLRGGDGSPYGWRKFTVSQQHFIRYCCHASIRALLGAMAEPVEERPGPGKVATP